MPDLPNVGLERDIDQFIVNITNIQIFIIVWMYCHNRNFSKTLFSELTAWRSTRLWWYEARGFTKYLTCSIVLSFFFFSKQCLIALENGKISFVPSKHFGGFGGENSCSCPSVDAHLPGAKRHSYAISQVQDAIKFCGFQNLSIVAT